MSPTWVRVKAHPNDGARGTSNAKVETAVRSAVSGRRGRLSSLVVGPLIIGAKPTTVDSDNHVEHHGPSEVSP
jgi:hypothetical protein